VSAVSDTPEEVRQLRRLVKDLQSENDDLRRDLRSRSGAYVRTEPSDLDSERFNLQLRQVREEAMKEL